MSLMGNICKNVLFRGLQSSFGASVAKFVVVTLVLLIGAGCNLQVRQTERAGLRKIPAVIVETVQSEESQAASSEEVVEIEGAGEGDVPETHIVERGNQGEPAGPEEELKASDPSQILPEEREAKEDSPVQIEAAPASLEESPAKFASLSLSPFRLRSPITQDNDVGAHPVLASLTTPAGGAKVSSLPPAEEPDGKEPESAPVPDEPVPAESGKSRDLPDTPAEPKGAGIGSVTDEPPSEPGGEGEGVSVAPALAKEDIKTEVEVAEVVPARAESDLSVAVLTSAVTVDAPQEEPAEKSQDEAATGKPAAEKPADRTGEGGSAPEAETEAKDSAPEAKTEGEDADTGGGGDAAAEPPAFPKGYLIVLVVCLALAVFKHTVGKI